MEQISDTIKSARKEHKCNLCEGIIKVGESYSHQVNKENGAPYTFKTHLKCGEIASKLDMFADCDDGLTAYDFYNNICEEYYTAINETDGCYSVPFQEKLKAVCDHHLG